MTVLTEVNSITYTGNASATNFTAPFQFFSSDQIRVTRILISTLAATELPSFDYTVNLPTTDTQDDGSIDYLMSGLPLSALYRLQIERVVATTQDTAIQNESGFDAEAIERQLDLMVMQIQQLKQAVADLVDGGTAVSLTGTVSGPASSVDDNFATFNGTGGNIIQDAGYGASRFALTAHTHSFASITSKPTTLAGYGITDAETLVWTEIVKAADSTIATNTVLASDVDLTFHLNASTNYVVEGVIYCDVSDVSGQKTAIAGPSATAIRAFESEQSSAGTYALSANNAYGALRTNTPGAAVRVAKVVNISVENGVGAGTFAYQFAQNVSDAAVLRIRKGSWLRWRVVA